MAQPHTDVATDTPKLIHVGPMQAVHTIAQAATLARNGDTVDIDAGDYVGDVAIWTQDHITIRGVGGRARLIADGKSAEEKAIWVIRGGHITVENMVFTGAAVRYHNGAGIRFEKGSLTIRNCAFIKNEDGILTSPDGDELVIEDSEFGYNGFGDGQSHGLYVGAIPRLKVIGSYFHHSNVGHLLKSRAAENIIMYNRLTDETGGTASYELEFPNGGLAYVVGNIIEQSATTQNPTIVSYGMEGYLPGRLNGLFLNNNTFVDDKPDGGLFLMYKPGLQDIRATNNLLVGKGRLTGSFVANNLAMPNDAFVQPSMYDYRLKKPDLAKLSVVNVDAVHNVALVPAREYMHPASTRRLTQRVVLPGALQDLSAGGQ
jgi:hypothetical protein